MKKIRITTLNGEFIEAITIKEYKKGTLCFAQERIIVTDTDNQEIRAVDMIALVEDIL